MLNLPYFAAGHPVNAKGLCYRPVTQQNFQGEVMIHAPPSTRRSARRRGYSLIEVLCTVLIIQIISGMVVVNVSSVQDNEKLSRAAEQIVVALRYARILAMSTGQPAGVEFDTATNQIRVFQGATATTVSNSQILGGTYLINLNTQADICNVKVSSALLSNDNTNPYQVIFGKLGGTLNNGYVTLSYGSCTRTVNIPLVGEATIQ
jgi:Tfp pilus assembly protein FimT